MTKDKEMFQYQTLKLSNILNLLKKHLRGLYHNIFDLHGSDCDILMWIQQMIHNV